jgi:hypothetical protein
MTSRLAYCQSQHLINHILCWKSKLGWASLTSVPNVTSYGEPMGMEVKSFNQNLTKQTVFLPSKISSVIYKYRMMGSLWNCRLYSIVRPRQRTGRPDLDRQVPVIVWEISQIVGSSKEFYFFLTSQVFPDDAKSPKTLFAGSLGISYHREGNVS